jgi:hypothetical protein
LIAALMIALSALGLWGNPAAIHASSAARKAAPAPTLRHPARLALKAMSRFAVWIGTAAEFNASSARVYFN